MKSGWQLTVPQGGRAGSIQPLGMGVEVLQALRDRRVAVQGEQGDVVGKGLSAEDHQQLGLRFGPVVGQATRLAGGATAAVLGGTI